MAKHYLFASVKAAGDGSDSFEVLASDATIDRVGESIDPLGWDISHFKNNPVILWAHKHDDLPIGRADEIVTDASGLRIRGTFASAEANPKAAQVRQLVKEGMLNAVSVGFIPTSRDEDDDTIIRSAELLELSFVPIPANPNALLMAQRRNLSLDLFDLKALKQQPDVPDNLRVQTLIFAKDIYTREDAVAWAEEREYKDYEIEETEESFRLKLLDEGLCLETTFRTINMDAGVGAIVCEMNPEQSEKQAVEISDDEATEEPTESVAVEQQERSIHSGSHDKGRGKGRSISREATMLDVFELRRAALKAYQDNEKVLQLTKRIISHSKTQ